MTREEELTTAVLGLSADARLRIARRLIDSIGFDEGVEGAWEEEIDRRIREIDSGEVHLLRGREVMDEIRALAR